MNTLGISIVRGQRAQPNSGARLDEVRRFTRLISYSVTVWRAHIPDDSRIDELETIRSIRSQMDEPTHSFLP